MSATPGLVDDDLFGPQPDSKGEFTTPAEGAKFMALLGIPQTPLNGKIPFLKDWPNKATTDFGQIDEWYAEYKCNFGSVMKAEPGGYYAMETDSANPRQDFKKATSSDLSARLSIKSGPSRAHWYYKHDSESLASLTNIGQTATDGFSLRVENEQCVSPGSIHPERKTQYATLRNSGFPSPATPEEINWWKSKKTQTQIKKAEELAGERLLIKHGHMYPAIMAQAGKLWENGFPPDKIPDMLVDWTLENCEGPIDEAKVRSYAKGSNWKQGVPAESLILIGGKVAGSAPDQPSSLTIAETEEERIARIEATIDTTRVTRPVFPHWIMEGCSIYRNLAEPVSRASGKQDVMIFMPAFIGMMNYAAGRVAIEGEDVCLNQHLGLVSPAGDYHKSSSCAVAFDYLAKGEFLTFSKLNPGGKIIQIQGGSPEGMGKTLFRANAKRAIVFYDELSKVVGKASIQSSCLGSDFLTWAESGLFENYVKSTSDSYSFLPKTYWFNWIWCTTEKGFDRQWGMLTEKESGLADRVCIVLSDDGIGSESSLKGHSSLLRFR
jgi:hypothetical protein